MRGSCESGGLFCLSKARGVLLGLATLIIAIVHAPYEPAEGSFLLFLRFFGSGAVDIFLLLSGMGLWFSFSKNGNVLSFWKKRLLRLLPPLLPILLVCAVFTADGAVDFLMKLSLVDLWVTGDRTFWYFSLLVLLYLFFPFIFKTVKKWGVRAVLAAAVLTAGISVLLYFVFPTVFSHVEIALLRVPVFFFGIWIGKYVAADRRMPPTGVTVVSYLLLSAVLYFIWEMPIVGRLLNGAAGVLFALALAPFLAKRRGALLPGALSKLGIYSAEYYLIQEKFQLMMMRLGKLRPDIFLPVTGEPLVFVPLSLILTLVFAAMLHHGVEWLLGAISGRKQRGGASLGGEKQ